MWKNASRRATSLLLTLVLILGLFPAVTIPAFAAEGPGLSDTGIGLVADGGTWSANGTTIMGQAMGQAGGTCDGSKAGTSTLTITNNKSTVATLSFDYTLTLDDGSVTIDGANQTTDGNFSKEMQPGDKVTVSIKTKEGAHTTTISMTNVFLLASGTFDVTFRPAEGGSYTVNGTEVGADGMTQNNKSSFAYSLNATPASGYKFLGWKNQDGTILSMASAVTLYFDQAATVSPWFIPADAAVFTVGKDYYTDFVTAITAAQSGGGVVVVAQSGTLAAGDYTIPSDVTLLVPFDAANTVYTTKPENTKSGYSKPTLYRKLTLAPNVNITVADGGAISVGSKHTGVQDPGPGSNTGPYGQIQMEKGSAITLQSGGKLYAYGFVTGSGEVIARSGAEVWEYFQICGWRGGTASSGMQGDAERVFPFSQYYVQNIEVPLTIHAEAKEMLYTSIYSSWLTQSAKIEFVGQNGLFSISGEGGSFRKQYLPDRDRLQIDFNGDMTINEINVQGFGSGDYVLPINGNITINVLSGTASIDKDMSFLPGAVVSVAQGAKMLVTETGNLFFYDRAEWVGKTYVWSSRDFRPVNYSPTRSYTRTTNDMTDAKLDVNGTVTVAGGLYTSAGGADIVSSQGSGTIVMQKTPDTTRVLYEALQSNTQITYQTISITPAVLKNSDGTYAATAGAEEGTTIAYEDGKWIVPDHVHSWSEWTTVTDATCTEQGTEKRVCSVCNKEETRATEARGHDFAAEWSHDGASHWHACSLCNATTEKVAHSGGAATCTAKATCAVCGAEYGELAAHTVVTDAAVAATCTTEGKTEGSHCSVCEAVIKAQETIDALGHDWSNPTFAWAEDGKSCTVTFACQRSDCGHTEQPEVTVSSAITKNPTCTAKGETTYTAKVTFNEQEYSNSKDVADIEMIAHSYSEDWKSDTASHWKECAVCHDKTQEAAHTFTWVVDKEATEDATGLKHEECSVCGYKRSENTVIDKLPHTHVGITHHEAVAATCHTTGNVEYWTCASDKCKGKYYKDSACNIELNTIVTPIDSGNHVDGTEVRDAVVATCDREGYTGDTYCLGCNQIIEQGKTIDALGHSWGEWTTVTDATCTEQGTEKRVCSVCNKEETRATEARGHDFAAEWSHDGASHWHACSLCNATTEKVAHSGGAATCTAKATCAVCGAEYGELAAHTMVTDVAVAPTCTIEGKTEGSHCSVCKAVIVAQETVPALGHNWGQPTFVWAEDGKSCTATFTCQNDTSHTEQVTAQITSQVKSPATCTEKGVTTYTAGVTFQGEQYTSSKDITDIDMIPHSYGAWQSSETNHWKECSICHDKIEETDHSFTWVVDKEATEYETGLKHEECSVCGYTRSENTVIDKIPHTSGGGGSSSGSSGNKTETEKNPDGSTTTTVTKPDGTVTETTKQPDGSTTQVVTKPDGSSTTTVDNKDGSSSTTTVSKDGQVEAEVKLPSAVVTDAVDKGEAVALPMPQVSATSDKETAPTVTVDLPAGTTAKVEIPVENVTAGTVAVLVKADGTEEIIKTSVTTENGVALTVADGAKVRIVDNAIDFIDVKEGYWGEDEIDFVTSRELFNGTSETTFTPAGAMTRAMVVTVLARYDDVDTTTGDTWYEAGADWAVENNVSDGTNLDDSVTREQLVTMLWRYVGSPVVESDLSAYPDSTSVSDWAINAMIWAVDAGIIAGNGAGELNPQGTATRAEVATMLARFVAKTN